MGDPSSFGQALVTRYAYLNAVKNLIQKWLDEKREIILAALAKHDCPTGGPYLLVLNADVDERINWKDQFAAYLKRLHWGADKIDNLFSQIEAAPREKAKPRLECKPNAQWKNPISVRLPK